MKKLIRTFIFIIVFFGTLILSNKYIPYYKIDDINFEIISLSKDASASNRIIKEDDMNNIIKSLEALEIESANIDEQINENSKLDFFKGTEKISFNYEFHNSDDKVNFGIDDSGLENLLSMKKLKEVNFNVEVDDYFLKRIYTYEYTKKQEEEFIKKLTKKLTEINKSIIKELNENDIKTNVVVKIQSLKV